MTEQEKRPYDDMAAELLNFLEIGKDAYRLHRASTFLQEKFADVDAMRRELEALRHWKSSWMPVVTDWSEHHNPPKDSPFGFLNGEE